jgi:hypothetical protein
MRNIVIQIAEGGAVGLASQHRETMVMFLLC